MGISIKWVFILSSIFLVWGTHLIITPSSYLSSERVLTRHVQDIMQNVVDLTLEQSNNHLNKAKSAASLAKQLLSANVVSSDIHGSASLERYFFDQLSIYPHLSGIYFASPNGNFFFVSRNDEKAENGYRTKIINHAQDGSRTVKLKWRDSNFTQIAQQEDPNDPYDPRKRPWYKLVMEQKDVVWTAPYIFYTSQKPGITIAGPSLNKDGDIKGVVGVDIEIDELSTFISKLRVGKSGQAFMLNRNGDVIAYENLSSLIVRKKEGTSFRLPKVSEINNDFIHKAYDSIDWKYDDDGYLRLDKRMFASFKLNDQKFISMFAPFPDHRLPWIIGVYMPEEDYLGEIRHNRLQNIIITVVISLLASLLGYALAKKITDPIVGLEKEAKAIEQNDLKTSFRINSVFRELQATASSFSRMKKSLLASKESLLEKEEIHRAITGTAHDAIIMMDDQQHVSYWNPAAEGMFGYSSAEVLGKNLHQIIAPSHYFSRYNKGLERFANGKHGEFIGKTVEVTAIHRDGTEFPVELSLSALKIGEKWHAVAIVRDITQRVKNEQIKKRLAHDLHDGIGGNLTNIKLIAELLQQKTDDDQTHHGLESIADISSDCISEVRNYMNVLDERELSWKNFMDELHQYCSRIVTSHEIELSWETAIHGNATPPNTLLYMNLFKMIKEAVNNAIKHANASIIQVCFQISDDEFFCSVKDNGHGLTPKAGSGRGLLSMQTRALELGGTFEIDSQDGVTARITIPIALAKKSAKA